jgi:hypothetical protein
MKLSLHAFPFPGRFKNRVKKNLCAAHNFVASRDDSLLACGSQAPALAPAAISPAPIFAVSQVARPPGKAPNIEPSSSQIRVELSDAGSS